MMINIPCIIGDATLGVNLTCFPGCILFKKHGTIGRMNDAQPHDASSLESGYAEQPIQATLQEGAQQLGLKLDACQFERYYRALTTWNKKFNLTAITEYQEVQIKHFLDSVVLAPLLVEEWGGKPPAQNPRLIDVGTGAGLPGIPLKIVCPQFDLTLLDGTGKKIRFLDQVVNDLELDRAITIQGRAEELGRNAKAREQYDLAVARAVAPLNTLVEYVLPLVRLGGLAALYKGASAAKEFIDARKAITLLGGETVRMAPVEIPFLDAQRTILLIKKVRPTPSQYPRGQGLARKQPLP